MKLRTYKGIVVGKGSALAEALEVKDKGKAAEKVFKDTTDRFYKTYPSEDCKWFMSHCSVAPKPEPKPETLTFTANGKPQFTFEGIKHVDP